MYCDLGPFIPRGCRQPPMSADPGKADKPAKPVGGGVASRRAELVLGVSVAPAKSYKLLRPGVEASRCLQTDAGSSGRGRDGVYNNRNYCDAITCQALLKKYHELCLLNPCSPVNSREDFSLNFQSRNPKPRGWSDLAEVTQRSSFFFLF